jgi:hypothetical protein
MQPGALISAIAHVVLVSVVMLSTPRQFVASERSVEAELVREDEVPQTDRFKPQPPEPEKPNVWDFPPDKPLIELPQFSPQARPNSAAAAPAPASKSAPPPAASAQPPPAPSNSQQAALSANPTLPQSSISQAPSAPPKGAPSVFDPSNIPMLMDLPNQQGGVDKGFDFEATVTANISAADRAAFKAHLRRCWKLPEGLSPGQNTRVVLRVYLRRDGGLASEPVLIEASASRDGPAVLQAAKSALAACQPYALPPESYREWRILDLTFTPKDMAGG